MGRNRPKKVCAKKRQAARGRKIANRDKDLDQIQEELLNPIPLPLDEDLPGMGQFYCMACARFFISQTTLSEHYKTTIHKRKLKLTLEKPYSIREAEAAAGMAPPKN